jgi:hypothetical protein
VHRAACPRCTHFESEALRAQIARPGEGVHGAAIRMRKLGEQMGCGAEPVQAQAPCAGYHRVGTIADQASTQQWSRVQRFVAGRQRARKARIGESVLRVAPSTS